MLNKHTIAIITLLMFAGSVVAVNVYTHPIMDVETNGHLYVTVRCDHGLFSKEMHLLNLNTLMLRVIYLNPDGTWDGEVPIGHYRLTLLDGNGGHPEEQEFVVESGWIYRVSFIGHAVSGDGTPTVTPTVVPTVVPTTVVTTPVIAPTTIPTTVPTTVITTVPTTVPTATPTVTPTKHCYKEKMCEPGYWTINCLPVWHPGKCTVTVICK